MRSSGKVPNRRNAGKGKGVFDRISTAITKAAGSPGASIGAIVMVVVWAICGPIFGFSETWQLVINTTTTIITFLMVFVIQQSQNKDTAALHMKLNELIASSETASNRLVDLEELSEAEIETVRKFYRQLARLAARESDIHNSHSLDEAASHHEQKRGVGVKKTIQKKKG